MNPNPIFSQRDQSLSIANYIFERQLYKATMFRIFLLLLAFTTSFSSAAFSDPVLGFEFEGSG